MGFKYIICAAISMLILVDCVPVEVVYTGDGCDCPRKLGYQINVPKPPKTPRKYTPCNHGYTIDVPPIQAKAKVSYTFDFSVEEPRPPRPEKQSKLDLYAKVDRVTMHKADCPQEFEPNYPPHYPPQPPPTSPCMCDQCGSSKPTCRYVNRSMTQCKCRNPKCSCNSRPKHASPNSINVKPIVVASGPLRRAKNPIRRKRELQRIFFRPRRHNFERNERYVKLYHKSLPKDQQGWLDMDLFSKSNLFKRKTKKVFSPHTGARIVKRDIKGEFDLLEKERKESDLTLPEIIQFMPETLQPNFKRGQCQFGCQNTFSHIEETINSKETERDLENTEATTTPETKDDVKDTNSNDIEQFSEKSNIAATFTKRNAALYGYQPTAASQILPSAPTSYTQQHQYRSTSSAQLNSQLAHRTTDLNYDLPRTQQSQSPCEQRKIYAELRKAAEQPRYVYDQLGHKYVEDQGQLHLMVSSSSSISDPFSTKAIPFQYTGDLEIPQIGYSVHSDVDPTVGAPHYPVQHISSALLDRIITDIVYRHPDFIDASSHYGGALVDPEPYQEQQTKDFLKKLIDGRLSMVFGEPEDHYLHYYPEPSYHSRTSNPYTHPSALTYYPAIY